VKIVAFQPSTLTLVLETGGAIVTRYTKRYTAVLKLDRAKAVTRGTVARALVDAFPVDPDDVDSLAREVKQMIDETVELARPTCDVCGRTSVRIAALSAGTAVKLALSAGWKGDAETIRCPKCARAAKEVDA